MRCTLVTIILLSACFSKPPEPSIDDVPYAVHIAAGGNHTCEIRDSHLSCWGNNDHGQLGEASAVATGVPTEVSSDADFVDGWTWVAAGQSHTCGINKARVVCWGDNAVGQVLPGASANDLRPTLVALPAPALRVYAHGRMTCAITTAFEAYCWGDLIDRVATEATRFAAPKTFTQFAIGGSHACAIEDGGGGTPGPAWCWGKNDHVQLGFDDHVDRDFNAPVQATNGQLLRSIAAVGQATCAVTTARELACWGSPSSGHLGADVTDDTSYLVVDNGHPWSRVAMGDNHLCAVAGGDVYCYGDDRDGALGDGKFDDHRELGAALAGVETTTEITASDHYSCALAVDQKTVHCWGSNESGELGTGVVATKVVPSLAVMAPGGEQIEHVISGSAHSCALVTSTSSQAGAIYCWGLNDNRQVDPKSSEMMIALPRKAFPDDVREIVAGDSHNCAIVAADDTKAHCWGANDSEQLGRAGAAGENDVISANEWTTLGAGGNTACGLDINEGKLSCWGHVPGEGSVSPAKDYGLFPRNGATPVPWQQLAIGSNYVLGMVGGQPQRVGAFGNGCLDENTATSQDSDPNSEYEMFTDLNLTQVQLATAGNDGAHACMHYVPDGGIASIVCWGENAWHQTGNANATNCVRRAVPRPSTTGGWSMPGRGTISTSAQHSCAIGSDHKIYCWGLNANFELGIIHPDSVPTPVNDEAWAEVATGRFHTCAITEDRSQVKCWGLNKYGELGDGAHFEPAPVPAGVP